MSDEIKNDHDQDNDNGKGCCGQAGKEKSTANDQSECHDSDQDSQCCDYEAMFKQIMAALSGGGSGNSCCDSDFAKHLQNKIQAFCCASENDDSSCGKPHNNQGCCSMMPCVIVIKPGMMRGQGISDCCCGSNHGNSCNCCGCHCSCHHCNCKSCSCSCGSCCC